MDNRSAADRAAEFEYVDLEVDSRGVMLPLSRDGDSVDFLWVVISAKSYADEDDSEQGPAIAAAEDATLEFEERPGDQGSDTETSDDFQNSVLSATDPMASDIEVSEGSVDEAEINADLSFAQDEARAHREAASPGFERLYGLLADALRLYEQAQNDPEPLTRRLKEDGLKVQKRAPYTPILKLIFGKDYDKTRLTEYGAAIAYAVREGVTSDGLAAFLAGAPGGIKGCVRAERTARRGDKTTTAHSRLKAARRKLRNAKTKPLTSVRLHGEFDLLLVRRSGDGIPEILGRADVSESTLSAIIERRARKTRRSKQS